MWASSVCTTSTPAARAAASRRWAPGSAACMGSLETSATGSAARRARAAAARGAIAPNANQQPLASCHCSRACPGSRRGQRRRVIVRITGPESQGPPYLEQVHIVAQRRAKAALQHEVPLQGTRGEVRARRQVSKQAPRASSRTHTHACQHAVISECQHGTSGAGLQGPRLKINHHDRSAGRGHAVGIGQRRGDLHFRADCMVGEGEKGRGEGRDGAALLYKKRQGRVIRRHGGTGRSDARPGHAAAAAAAAVVASAHRRSSDASPQGWRWAPQRLPGTPRRWPLQAIKEQRGG